MKPHNTILADLKSGSSQAFKEIFNAFYTRLCAFSLKYVKDTYAAEEIVENTLFRLWEKRAKLEHVTNLKAYLYGMVRNACYDYLKDQKKYVRLDHENHDMPSASVIEHFIIEEEAHAILIQALESLPQKCRKVFELSCIEGVKYKDIAEDLQISINTVKSQRARAIELLKERLKEHPFLLLLLSAL